MVNEYAQEPLDDIIELTDGVVSEEDEVVEEPVEETPDPLAERLGKLEQSLSRFDGFDPNEVKSNLGRVRAIQSKLDQITSTNPLADISPRIDATEALLNSIASALIVSDFTDDAAKTALRQAQTSLDESRTQRERKQMRDELLAEVTKASTPEPQIQDPQAQAATLRVVGYAEAKGIDPQTIPAQVWSLLPNETFDQAVTRVKAVVDTLATRETATVRTAERRQAAGSGSPSRSGANSLEADRQRLQSAGIPITETETRKRIAKELGVAIEY